MHDVHVVFVCSVHLACLFGSFLHVAMTCFPDVSVVFDLLPLYFLGFPCIHCNIKVCSLICLKRCASPCCRRVFRGLLPQFDPCSASVVGCVRFVVCLPLSARVARVTCVFDCLSVETFLF